MSIINKIEAANLVGRGGAGFPVGKKWQAVFDFIKKRFSGGNNNEVAWVICNVSEGEPGVRKDRFILENFSEKVIDGINLAIDYLSDDGKNKIGGLIYLNEEYYYVFNKKLKEIIGEKNIRLFKKPHIAGYIGGEESALLNTIERGRAEPRIKPPFPVEIGLWGKPTIINNVETFYNVSLVEDGKYEYKRFFTIDGDARNPGVYCFEESLSVSEVLKKSDNFPKEDFFVQVGGAGSGEVLSLEQLENKVTGAGSLRLYSQAAWRPHDIIAYWLNFFKEESCGQCTPCREGTYRLKEIFESKDPDWPLFKDLLDNLKDTSFCALGASVSIPIFSYLENVLKINLNNFEEYKKIIN